MQLLRFYFRSPSLTSSKEHDLNPAMIALRSHVIESEKNRTIINDPVVEFFLDKPVSFSVLRPP